MSADNWLRLDEIDNAIDNLSMCGRFLAEIRAPIRWKWAVVALHQALYGFAVCVVQGTDSRRVLKNPEDWSSHLISIHEALKRTKDPSHIWPGAVPLSTTEDEQRAIERLVNEFRNGFEHFAPKGWSIEVSGMPGLFRHALRVVRHLAIDSGSIRYESDEQLGAVRSALESVEAAL